MTSSKIQCSKWRLPKYSCPSIHAFVYTGVHLKFTGSSGGIRALVTAMRLVALDDNILSLPAATARGSARSPGLVLRDAVRRARVHVAVPVVAEGWAVGATPLGMYLDDAQT